MLSVKQKRLSVSSIVILFTPVLFTGLSLVILDLQQASYMSQTVVYDAALYFGIERNPLRQTTDMWACDGLWNCAEVLCRFSLLPNVSWIAFRTLPSNDNESCDAITNENIARKLFGGDDYKTIRDLMLSAFIMQFVVAVSIVGLLFRPSKSTMAIYGFFILSSTILISVPLILWMKYSHRLSDARGDYPPQYVVDRIFRLNILLLIIIFTLPEAVLIYLWKELNDKTENQSNENTPINYM